MIYPTHSRFARARTAKVRINFGIQNQISQNYAKITLILNGFYPPEAGAAGQGAAQPLRLGINSKNLFAA